MRFVFSANRTYDPFKVDVYCVAKLMAACIGGNSALRYFAGQDFDLPHLSCSAELRELLEGCLQREPPRRWNSTQLRNSTWVVQALGKTVDIPGPPILRASTDDGWHLLDLSEHEYPNTSV